MFSSQFSVSFCPELLVVGSVTNYEKSCWFEGCTKEAKKGDLVRYIIYSVTCSPRNFCWCIIYLMGVVSFGFYLFQKVTVLTHTARTKGTRRHTRISQNLRLGAPLKLRFFPWKLRCFVFVLIYLKRLPVWLICREVKSSAWVLSRKVYSETKRVVRGQPKVRVFFHPVWVLLVTWRWPLTERTKEWHLAGFCDDLKEKKQRWTTFSDL